MIFCNISRGMAFHHLGVWILVVLLTFAYGCNQGRKEGMVQTRAEGVSGGQKFRVESGGPFVDIDKGKAVSSQSKSFKLEGGVGNSISKSESFKVERVGD